MRYGYNQNLLIENLIDHAIRNFLQQISPRVFTQGLLCAREIPNMFYRSANFRAQFLSQAGTLRMIVANRFTQVITGRFEEFDRHASTVIRFPTTRGNGTRTRKPSSASPTPRRATTFKSNEPRIIMGGKRHEPDISNPKKAKSDELLAQKTVSNVIRSNTQPANLTLLLQGQRNVVCPNAAV